MSAFVTENGLQQLGLTLQLDPKSFGLTVVAATGLPDVNEWAGFENFFEAIKGHQSAGQLGKVVS